MHEGYNATTKYLSSFYQNAISYILLITNFVKKSAIIHVTPLSSNCYKKLPWVSENLVLQSTQRQKIKIYKEEKNETNSHKKIVCIISQLHDYFEFFFSQSNIYIVMKYTIKQN